jgi:hypothetical protein
MNCKPGDLAIVLGGSRWSGRIVLVHSLSPRHDFVLPDGTPQKAPSSDEAWILESMCGPFGLPPHTQTRFGVGADRKLRPLRPSDEADEMLRIAGKPVKEIA